MFTNEMFLGCLMFRQVGTYRIMTKPDISASCAKIVWWEDSKRPRSLTRNGKFQKRRKLDFLLCGIVKQFLQILQELCNGLTLWNCETIPLDSSPTL